MRNNFKILIIIGILSTIILFSCENDAKIKNNMHQLEQRRTEIKNELYFLFYCAALPGHLLVASGKHLQIPGTWIQGLLPVKPAIGKQAAFLRKQTISLGHNPVILRSPYRIPNTFISAGMEFKTAQALYS